MRRDEEGIWIGEEREGETGSEGEEGEERRGMGVRMQVSERARERAVRTGDTEREQETHIQRVRLRCRRRDENYFKSIPCTSHEHHNSLIPPVKPTRYCMGRTVVVMRILGRLQSSAAYLFVFVTALDVDIEYPGFYTAASYNPVSVDVGKETGWIRD